MGRARIVGLRWGLGAAGLVAGALVGAVLGRVGPWSPSDPVDSASGSTLARVVPVPVAPPDAGLRDMAPLDAAPSDARVQDSVPTDVAPPDADDRDTGPADSSVVDATELPVLTLRASIDRAPVGTVVTLTAQVGALLDNLDLELASGLESVSRSAHTEVSMRGSVMTATCSLVVEVSASAPAVYVVGPAHGTTRGGVEVRSEPLELHFE